MAHMAHMARRFGVLVVGVAAIVASLFVYELQPRVTSFGWTAYAPPSNTVFLPFISPWTLAAALLMLLGTILVAGWIGFAAGRRRPSPPTSPVTDPAE